MLNDSNFYLSIMCFSKYQQKAFIRCAFIDGVFNHCIK
jgi:hypothetical protein